MENQKTKILSAPALGLLRTRPERPRCRRTAEKRDERAPLHVFPEEPRVCNV
jgi:hypothetical protein